MVRMQIQFTEEQARHLKRLAAARQVSVAAVTREAVERLLVEGGDPGSVDGRAQALGVMGRFNSGRSDISADHDRYLDEIYADRG